MDEFLVIEFNDVIEGKPPMVYLINSEKIEIAKKLAENAKEEWEFASNEELHRIIETKWRMFHIWHKRIGYVNVPAHYLPDNWLSEKVERVKL